MPSRSRSSFSRTMLTTIPVVGQQLTVHTACAAQQTAPRVGVKNAYTNRRLKKTTLLTTAATSMTYGGQGKDLKVSRVAMGGVPAAAPTTDLVSGGCGAHNHAMQH